MIRLFGFIVLFLCGCSAKNTPNTAPNFSDSYFVQLDNPLITLSVVDGKRADGSPENGVVLEDAFLSSEVISDKEAKYIFALKFGIALSIPNDILKQRKPWTYKGCTFSRFIEVYTKPDGSKWSFPIENQDIHAFSSKCEKSTKQNDYLLTSSGELLAFEIYEKNKAGDKIRTITFVAINQFDVQ